MKAKTGIAQNEELVSIPRKFALWVTKSKKCPFPDWVDATYFKDAPWFVKLALMVLHEKKLGPESKVRFPSASVSKVIFYIFSIL